MAELLYYATPFFLLLLGVEYLAYKHLSDDYAEQELVGFEGRDAPA